MTTLHQYLTDELRAPLWALFAAVACVLLVACANVANLLLARIAGRGQELVLRSALGAGRLQLAGQVLLESAILAVIGGSLGLLFADWLRLLLVGQLSPAVRQSAETGLDLKVLAFAFLVAILAAGFSGLLPALRAAKVRFGGGLRGSGGTGAAGRQGLHRALVALEAGLAVILVLGAGLLSKNFATLLDVDPGFDTSNVLTAPLQPTFAETDEDALEAARIAWFEQVVQRVADIPGVESVGAINRLPLTEGNVGISFRLADDDPEAGFRTVSARLVTPRLIETLRIPLLRGRPLSAGDRADSPLVGLVSESLAKELWGDRDPIGERLVFDNGELWFTVVGVVGDIHQNGLAQPPKTLVYQPLAQAAWERRMALAVRTSGDPAQLTPALKEAIWDVDPQVPIGTVTTMNELAQESLHDARLLTGLFGLFAGLVLLLAAVGVFGVTTYAVSQSRHENGVRLALGATGSDVVRTTLRRMLTPVIAGLVAGCVVARFALSSLQGFLTTVEVFDPWVYAAVPLGLAAVAALAAWIPARQATLADPMTVLSSD